MMVKPKFSILTLLVLTALVAHICVKQQFARRLVALGGTIDSTWIPFVIQVRVPEQIPGGPFGLFPDGQVTVDAICVRRYVGLFGSYTIVSTNTQLDYSKPIQVEGFHYHNRDADPDSTQVKTADTTG